jgi:hypothetical protein
MYISYKLNTVKCKLQYLYLHASPEKGTSLYRLPDHNNAGAGVIKVSLSLSKGNIKINPQHLKPFG